MRVLHVSDHFPPALGGIEMHLASLAGRQTLAGHEVSVLTAQLGDPEEDLARHRFPVVRARSRRKLSVQPRDYDVVHAHVSVVAPFTGPVVARWAHRGIPVLVTVHSLWSGLGPVPGWSAAACGLASAPVRWTAVSGAAAKTVADQLPTGVAVHVLPNAVDLTARAMTPDMSTREVRMVSTMRVARRKRPLPLIALFDRVRRQATRPVKLTIVGSGPQLGRLRAEIRRRGLDGMVSLTGRLEPTEVASVVSEHDVYVAPALLESFGLAALEARALGLPVVGLRGTGLVDFVDVPEGGLLAQNDHELVAALVHLVDSPSELCKMAERNRTSPPSYTWARALDAHDSVYDEVAARTHRPGPQVVR